MKKIWCYSLIGLLSFGLTAWAGEKSIEIQIYQVAKTGHAQSIGTVTAQQTKYGVLFTPNLQGLSPGAHGFHIHQNPSCDDNGMAAGGHYDPSHSDKHLGPYENGHQGDIAILMVDKNGNATLPALAPRLKLSEIKGHSLMIHEGGDNYSDRPEKLGGGGARIACGVIE